MDLIDDLGNELALAFLVDRKLRQKIDSRQAKSLIERVKAVLDKTAVRESDRTAAAADQEHKISH